MELPKAYNPADYEDKIYQKWEESGLFNPDNLKLAKNAKPCLPAGRPCLPAGRPFSIVLPPPNVTGTLHLGHAVMLAIQDVMTRYHRMKGDKTLWLPGTDHAAIATQTKVEKILMKEGLRDPKKELGREKFLARVRQFAQESHDTIVNQCKKMGASLDWSREAFTLDEPRTLAVRTVFKKMYDDGLIYRGYRIVNWCPRCQSTLADDEIEYKEQKAKLYIFKYSSDFPFAIATTRPETKLGDTAVAVNPKDKRYKKYIGKIFEIKKFAGGPDLRIKVIGSREVDMKFGTGALGVTPAHSLVDYKMAQENDLPVIKVIGEDGKMTKETSKEYAGLGVLEAREKVIRNLIENGSIDKHVTMPSFQNNLSVCYRCDTPIEPLPSRQWFISVSSKFKVQSSKIRGVKAGQKTTLKELMQKVVKNGQIKIIPERFKKTYFHWIDNLNDWCISRQIWYGHQIPVWYRERIDSKTVKICFMRHGQTDWNIKSIMQGQTETELNETGRKQAKEKTKAIEDFNPDIIISSPQKRCLDTVKIAIGGKYETITDDRLKERYYGKIEGLRISEIKEKYPSLESFTKNNLPYLIECPGGESYEDVYKRVKNLLIDAVKKYPGKKILIMSHGDPLDMMEAIIKKKIWKEGIGLWHDNTRCVEAVFNIDADNKLDAKFKTNGADEEIYVGVDAPEGKNWIQDPDTLDTWFSSGLWTFSTLGWPQKTVDLKTFHPTSVMETGYDILFFWVARMILMTTYVLGEVPFETVYLHGLVRDEQGRKMSKSLGNVIDPLDMVKKYGTDAVRLALLLGNTPGNDMALSEEKIAGFRNFTNKLWNISRFVSAVILSLPKDLDSSASPPAGPSSRAGEADGSARNDRMPRPKTLADEWMLGRLRAVIAQTTKEIENFNFSSAGEKLREFTWNDLADWYLEIAKIEGDKSEILNYILIVLLRLWHPFMPFVTEAIWREVYGKKEILMVADWPTVVTSTEAAGRVEKSFGLIKDLIAGIRVARADSKIEPAKKINVFISGGKHAKLLSENAELIKRLWTNIDNLEIKEKIKKEKNWVTAFVGSGVEVHLDLSGAVDLEKEKARIVKELEEAKKYLVGLEKKLSNQEFIKNAPKEIVEKEKQKKTETEERLKKLEEQTKQL